MDRITPHGSRCTRRRRIGGVCLMAVFWLSGCFGPTAPQIRDSQGPAIQPPQPAISVPAASANPGSLWQADTQLTSLYGDFKARRVGDIVTIHIVESATASNKATTATGRKSGISAGIDNFFNLESRFPTSRPDFSPFAKVGADISSTFDGTGETKRSGDLTAYVTARVTEVLPNGNFIITGSRSVTVNHEEQQITLTGMIRPRDISTDNVVLSTYIADARITYSGEGIVQDRQRPGWLARLFDFVWPF